MAQYDYSLKETLMQRDDMTEEEADEAIAEAREEIAQGADPEQVCYDNFGLEPDYIWDLI